MRHHARSARQECERVNPRRAMQRISSQHFREKLQVKL
jgi:hypothetical protein